MSTARDALLQRAVAWFGEHGVGDTSMRALAAALGTSHRMLHYHFGSREGLLGAVMEHVEHSERDELAHITTSDDDPLGAALNLWHRIADAAETFAPLFFELSSHAMLGHEYAQPWRAWVAGWTAVTTSFYEKAGAAPGEAETLARLSLAQTRGLLFEVALTGDRSAADVAMARFVAMMRAALPDSSTRGAASEE
ncbi:TetR/AcrR family transcriptional regulator [Isoptericola sp. BMS4]|uniref:TetR/AcrR family transcriptional regulator n=1 Tax=Isoptericola sp. BMS4 TaxID=2527875 RepID=UPI00210510EC|nr:TetR/AcrR family transcriptional regulator [Isoptericola sp. BMS4]